MTLYAYTMTLYAYTIKPADQSDTLVLSQEDLHISIYIFTSVAKRDNFFVVEI